MDAAIVSNNGERQAGATLAEIRADHRGRYQFAANILSAYARTMPIAVLDAACGTGYGARIIHDALGERLSLIWGVDRSQEAIAWGITHFGGNGAGAKMGLCEGDCLNLSGLGRFRPEAFDAVVSFETLEHLDAVAFLAQVREVLKPGGLLIASTPNQDVLPWSPAFEHHLRHYTGAEFDALLETAGFSIVGHHSNVDRESEEITYGYGGPFNIAIAERAAAR